MLYETVPIDSYWAHKGDVYQVTETTAQMFILTHVRSGQPSLLDWVGIMKLELVRIDPKDVPLALLGDV